MKEVNKMKIANTIKIAEISAKEIFPEDINNPKYILDYTICFYKGNDGYLYHCNKDVHNPRLRKANKEMIERFERTQNAK